MSPENHPLDIFLRLLQSTAALSNDDLEAIKSIDGKMRRLDAGAYLVREGDAPKTCGVIVEGYAFRQKITGDGSRQILSVCIPGDAVDLQNIFLNIADHAVQMMTRGIVVDLDRDRLQQLVLTRPGLGAALIQLSLIEAAIVREWVVNVGRRDSRERIAHLLCEFAVRLDARGLSENGDYELPMTQEQLADATGLTPVHVNRVLKGLEAEGLISRRRRHIHFADWRGLQEVADFSRQYLHLPEDERIDHAAMSPTRRT